MKGVGNKRLAIIFLASELRPTDERTGAVGSQRQQTEQETEGKKRVLYNQHRKMGIEDARACTRPRNYTADRGKLRSEKHREGKDGVSRCRSRWRTCDTKKKNKNKK